MNISPHNPNVSIDAHAFVDSKRSVLRRVVAACVLFGLFASAGSAIGQDAKTATTDSSAGKTSTAGAPQKSTESTDSSTGSEAAADATKAAAKKADEPKAKPAEKADGRIHLISADFPKGWRYFSAESGTRLSDVWRVEKSTEPNKHVLICKGKPEGYLRTEVEFDDFEMGFQWMYPTDENGNSGVLLNMAPKDKIWPDSIQLQLHRPAAGSIFPSGGGKSETALTLKDLSAELNKWNTCKLISRNGTITVEDLNGKKIGEVTGCLPARGRIALQSEGSEIHFRNIWIRKLEPEKTKTAQPQTTDAAPNVKSETTGT